MLPKCTVITVLIEHKEKETQLGDRRANKAPREASIRRERHRYRTMSREDVGSTYMPHFADTRVTISTAIDGRELTSTRLEGHVLNKVYQAGIPCFAKV